MKLDPISLSIPIFFILIGVEVLVARLRHAPVYRFNDSINDLACGILSQVWGLFVAVLLLGNYVLVYEHLRVLDPWDAENPLTWVLAFLGVDFFYYWYHRFSHECAVGWAFHVVHHQSEEYNLTVALRQDSFQGLHSHLFYLPLAVLGCPPSVMVTCAAFNTLYQFWIHTRLVDRLGVLEWVINTPSHHRVHHGSDAKYLDRNYGGVFIVFDRWFGSFQNEEEEPHYGILEPLRSWNPVWANFQYPVALWRKFLVVKGPWNKLQVWFRGPGWTPRGEPAIDVNEKVAQLWARGRYDARAPEGAHPYVLVQFVGGLLVTVALLFGKASMPVETQALLTGFIVWTLVNLGGVFDQARWVLVGEPLRLVAAVSLVMALGSGPWWGLAVVPVGCLAWFLMAPWRGAFRSAVA